jgi:hypothetical protein
MSPVLSILLQFFLGTVILTLGVTVAAKLIFPKYNLSKRIWRSVYRYALRAPGARIFNGFKWLTIKLIDTRPEFRIHQTYLENYPVAPLQFFDAIVEILHQQQIIGINIYPVVRREWGLLSPRRLYLVIRYRGAACFIGAARFGTALEVSWRYTATPSKLLLILFQLPWVGRVAGWLMQPPTSYRADMLQAFEQAVRSTVLEATGLLHGQGARPLTDVEQQPLLRQFYG